MTRAHLGPIALHLAAGVALAAPLALGGAHAVVAVPMAAVAVAALLLHVVDRSLGRGHMAVSRVSLPIVIGLVATAFSLVPLPRWLRRALSPEATERMEYVTSALSPEAQELVLPVLSQDPPATALALVRLVAALSIFVVIADRARSRADRRRLYRLVLGFAIALIVVTGGHTLLGAETIYGTSIPAKAYLLSIAPLVNPNHLGRAAGVFAILLLARGLEGRIRGERAVYLVVSAGCAAVAFLTESHGAALALTVTAGAMFTLWRGDTADAGEAVEKEERSRLRVLVLLGAPLLLIGVTVVVFRNLIARALGDGGAEFVASSKFGLYPPAARVIVKNLLVGTGNNAFQAAVGPELDARTLWTNATVSHPENAVLQVLADHGALVGGGLLVLCALIAASFLAPALQRRAPPLVFGAVFFLVLGDLVDFSLEVAFGLWICVLALAMATGHTRRQKGKAVRLNRPAMAGGAALLVVTLGLGGWLAVADERWSVDRTLMAGDATLERAVARHPHDGHFAYRMAVNARRRRDVKDALAWANRAVLLWPGNSSGHLEAARALASLGATEQALLEYRLAAERGRAELLEVMSRTTSLELRLRAVPEQDLKLHNRLCELVRRRERDFEQAEGCFRALAAKEGAPRSARRRAVEMAILTKDAARARAELALIAERPTAETATLWAQLIELEQGREAAWTQSASWFEGTPPTELLEWRLELAVKMDELTEALGLVRKLKKRPLSTRSRARMESMEATLLERAGRSVDAVRAWQKIARRRPKDIVVWLKLAALEHRLGLADDARRDLERARALNPKHPGVKRLEARMLRAP
jgi:tetratricopeptide (TPR) repeat protein